MHLNQPAMPIDTWSAPEAVDWDESAFTALVEQFEPLVLSICYRITGNRADAEDAAQATFLAMAQHLRARQRIDHLPAWVRGVARNCASHVSTAAARRARHERQAAGQATQAYRVEDTQLTGQARLAANLTTELQRLPPAQRRALELHYFEGQQLEAISATLGVASGTVASWLSRGRSRLRKQLRLTDAALTWALAFGLRWSKPSPVHGSCRGIRHHCGLLAGVAGLGLVAMLTRVPSVHPLPGPPPVSQSSVKGMPEPTAAHDPLAVPAARMADATPGMLLQGGYQMSLQLGPPHMSHGALMDPALTAEESQPIGSRISMPDGRSIAKVAPASLGARTPFVFRHPTLHLSTDPSALPLTLEVSKSLTISLPPSILATLLKTNGGAVVLDNGPSVHPR